MGFRDDELKIFTGNANPVLAQEIATHLGLTLGALTVGRFSNGEIRVIVEENVRGSDVFVIQPTCAPANDNVMELLLLLDAFRRASARRITAVIPYFGYARQDRKARGREPISAKLIANLITTAGADRILTMDLHAPQIQGFFDIPLDHLVGTPILGDHFQAEGFTEDAMIVAPDAGGGNRARIMAERLNLPIGFVDKRRPEPGVAEVMNIIGKVQGRTCILIDDIIDTGGTLALAAAALLERGAKKVFACATHAVLSGPGVDRMMAAPIEQVAVTDTIPLPATAGEKFKVLSVAPILGEAILRIHEDLSVSRLFE